MSRFLKFVLVLLFPALIIVISTAVLLADPGNDPTSPRLPSSSAPAKAASPSAIDGTAIVQDGGFESGFSDDPNDRNAYWEEFSTNFGSPLCDALSCNGSNFAHSGNYWAWLGGEDEEDEISSITQTITIPASGYAVLSFYFRIPVVNGAGGNDFFRVDIDGNNIFEVTDTAANQTTYNSYTLIEIDVSSYADGQPHQLRFYAEVTDGLDNFFLDDIALTVDQFVFLPVVLNNYCVPPSYSEQVLYDMSIIDAPQMWGNIAGFCKPGEGIVVAVIDTGVDLDHPDLAANLVPGATFISGTSTPNDDQGHGTHVAGSVAAAMNDIGIIGVAPFAKIMPVKVLSASGSGSVAGVAAGIRWAADNGAKVINLSLGGSSFTSLELDAVNYATAKGVLVIAAAGNCGHPTGYILNRCPSHNSTSYPAAFDNAMAVASTNSFDGHSPFSTQKSYVEIAAPGSEIYSTIPGGGYDASNGTSQATPHVAGLAAAVWSRNPALTNGQVRNILNATAVDLGTPGRDNYFGYGRIDANDAVLSSGTSSLSVQPMAVVETAVVINPDAPFVPGEVIVKLDTVSAQSADDVDVFALGITSSDVTITRVEAIDAHIMTVPVGEELDYIELLNSFDGIEYAELNYIVTIQ